MTSITAIGYNFNLKTAQFHFIEINYENRKTRCQNVLYDVN